MGSLFSKCRCRSSGPDEVSNPQHGETARRASVYYSAVESEEAANLAYPPATEPFDRAKGSIVMDEPETLLRMKDDVSSTVVVKEGLEEPRVRVARSGYPGELSQKELEACLQFRHALKENPDSAYAEMVHCFQGAEPEPYALCRYLRARKFNVDDTVAMIEKNVQKWKDARDHDFYPNLEEAVGCPESVFFSQFPKFVHGYSKNSCPVHYFMAGRMTLQGMECIMEVERVPGFLWHHHIFDWKQDVAALQAVNPNVVLFETVSLVDLKGLDTSQLNRHVLKILGDIASMKGCFPELMNKLIVLNAPGVFSFFWKLVKAILDPRTVAKIEIYSNGHEGNKRLMELVDKEQLLSDYGGNGPSSESLTLKNTTSTRFAAKQMKTNDHHPFVVELTSQEKATVSIYTRATSLKGILKKDDKELKSVDMNASDGVPRGTQVASDVRGPGTLQVSAKSSSNHEYYVVYVDVFPL